MVLAKDFKDYKLWDLLPDMAGSARRQAIERLDALTQCETVDELHVLMEGIWALLAVKTADEAFENLKVAAFAFNRRFPGGSVDILYKHPRCLIDPTIIRNLARLATLSLPEIRELIDSPHRDSGVAYVDLAPAPYFTISNQLGYPALHGIIVRTIAWDIHLAFSPPRSIGAVSHMEAAVRGTTHDILLAQPPLDVHLRTVSLSEPQRHFLRTWTCLALNRLFSQLTYLGSFADPTSREINPVRQWADVATVHDIIALTNRAVATSDPTLIVVLCFDVLDRYCRLGDTDLVALLDRGFLRRATAAIDPALGDIKNHFVTFLEAAVSGLFDNTWNGLYSASTRNAASISLRNKAGTPTSMSRDSYVPLLLNTLRNTTHGYDLDDARFERILMPHSGVVTADFRDLVLGLFYVLLSDPQVFWRKRARMDLLVPKP